MIKTRIDYIDVCRGIAMVLVIVGHIIPTGYFLHDFIYSFHVSLFFLISGFFYKPIESKVTFSLNIKNTFYKNYKLINSYIFYSVISIILNFFNTVGNEGNSLVFKNIITNLFFTFSTFGIETLWFLSTLFLAFILLNLLFSLKRKKFIYLFSLVMLIITWKISEVTNLSYFTHGIGYYLTYLLISLFRPFAAMFFVLNGFILKNVVLKIINYLNILFSVVIVILLAGALIFIIPYTGHVDFHFIKLGVLPVFLLSSFLGSFMTIIVSKLLSKILFLKKLFIFISQNTIFIMVTHTYVLLILKLNFDDNYILLTGFTLIIELLLVKLLGIRLQSWINRKWIGYKNEKNKRV